MKKFLVAATALSALLAFVGSASAADVATEPAYDWSGFYLGAHAGYGWGDAEWTNTESNSTFTDYAVGTSDSHNMEGFLGGLQAGFNWQVSSLVLGGELSISGSDIDGNSTSTVGAADDEIETNISWLTLATVRVGFAIDNLLPYVKAGYAGGKVDMDLEDITGASGSWDSDEWHDGYIVGAGLEYGMTSNISLGLEYNFIDLGSQNHSATGSTGDVDAFDVEVDDIHAITARLNWRF